MRRPPRVPAGGDAGAIQLGESGRGLSRSLTQPSPQRYYAFSSRLPSASPSSDEDVSVSAGIGPRHRRRSTYDYFRLPDPLLRLSVLKLDGSSFDVQIMGSASVKELKAAIEDIFIRASPAQGANGDISWSHVWGHFCLCFNYQKLTDDKASLGYFGIKDGDQLHFIRHLSLNQYPGKRRTKSCVEGLDLAGANLTSSSSMRRAQSLEKEGGRTDAPAAGAASSDDLAVRKEMKFGRLFKRWFCYSKRRSSRKKKSEKLGNEESSTNWLRDGSETSSRHGRESWIGLEPDQI